MEDMKQKTYSKCGTRWNLAITDYPQEQREKAMQLAKADHRSIGSFVASLLDKAIQENEQRAKRAAIN